MSKRSRSLIALLFALALATSSFAGTREEPPGRVRDRNPLVKRIVQILKFVLVPLEDTIGGPRP